MDELTVEGGAAEVDPAEWAGGSLPRSDRSLRRRLRFEGDCRYLFDRLGLLLGGRTRIHRIPERLFVTGFDLLESVRTRALVPSLGNPRTAFHHAVARLPQHPRYLGYWHDPARNTLVGMHLGVDLIRSDGAYYVMELNLNAGMGRARTLLYQARTDPMVTGLVDFAASRGFRRMVALRDWWRASYRRDLTQAGLRVGLQGDGPGVRRAALPDPLESDTLYVISLSRHTAVDHFVHDKGCTSAWLPEHLPGSSAPPVRSVPTRREPFSPAAQAERWPDLVVKMASVDRKEGVHFIKLTPGADVLSELGMTRSDDTPSVLRTHWGRRLQARLLARHQVLYQPFVPPDLTEDGRATRFRMNMLVTPVGSAFLSAHRIVSGFPVPAQLPPGPVADRRPFLATYGEGGAFEPTDPETEADLRRTATVVGEAVHRAVTATFVTDAG